MEDAKHHLELEEERLGMQKATTNSGPERGQGQKCKYGGFFKKKGKGQVSKKPKYNQQGKKGASVRNKKMNMAQLKCYNCENMGHFARDCPEPKKTREPPTI